MKIIKGNALTWRKCIQVARDLPQELSLVWPELLHLHLLLYGPQLCAALAT